MSGVYFPFYRQFFFQETQHFLKIPTFRHKTLPEQEVSNVVYIPSCYPKGPKYNFIFTLRATDAEAQADFQKSIDGYEIGANGKSPRSFSLYLLLT